jgi:hypothetical protein
MERNFTKVIRPGTLPTFGGSHVSVYINIKYNDGCLSITGVIGPRPSGNCYGGCGQIDMEFAHRNPADNDKRNNHPTPTSEFTWAPGWTADMWLELLDIWNRWHLNDMKSGCEHQRALGWTSYDEHPSEPCPVCGYKYGSAWLREEVPADVLEWLRELPDTDRQPAWV